MFDVYVGLINDSLTIGDTQDAKALLQEARRLPGLADDERAELHDLANQIQIAMYAASN